MENLEIIRDFISSVARRAGFSREEANKIELAVDEACTNIIKHAYGIENKGDIGIILRLDYYKLTILLTDHGKSFDFDRIKIPDMDKYLAELRVGGLGIYLMKTLMDDVSYRTTSTGENEVKMVKYYLKDDNSLQKVEEK